jgi:Icc-related predicted phosphoesterase
MNIGFITDTHDDPRTMAWLEEAARKYDIVCIGGDLGRSLQGQIVDFVIGHDNAFMVFGNHDNPVTSHPRILDDSKIQYRGVTIGGIGGALPAGGFPNEHDETEYLIMAGNLGKVDVLLLHQPPIDTRCDTVWDGRHIGSVAIRRYIEESQPLLSLSGHVHESPGIDRIGRTVIANPGAFFDTGDYLEATIDPVTVALRKGLGPISEGSYGP